MAASHIFRIMFVNQGKVYEIYARQVGHGDLFGFIEVEELLCSEIESRLTGASATGADDVRAGLTRELTRH